MAIGLVTTLTLLPGMPHPDFCREATHRLVDRCLQAEPVSRRGCEEQPYAAREEHPYAAREEHPLSR